MKKVVHGVVAYPTPGYASDRGRSTLRPFLRIGSYLNRQQRRQVVETSSDAQMFRAQRLPSDNQRANTQVAWLCRSGPAEPEGSWVPVVRGSAVREWSAQLQTVRTSDRGMLDISTGGSALT